MPATTPSQRTPSVPAPWLVRHLYSRAKSNIRAVDPSCLFSRFVNFCQHWGHLLFIYGKVLLLQDLAVKIEGTFILRYRVFDIFAKKYNDNQLAIQTECYGGAFRVYSTKDFPGLQASTELTKVRRLLHFQLQAKGSLLICICFPLHEIGSGTMGCTS